MPTSDGSNILPIILEVCRLRPQKVLDLGIGFGKYGVLLREYLDVGAGRFKKEDWQVCIVGVEGFEPYRNPVWGIYDEVIIEDFSEHSHHYTGFDVVLLVDSLEHLEKSKGETVLRHLLARNKHVIVSVPNGDYPQGAVNGNEFECHRARWRLDDFRRFGGRIIRTGVCIVASIPGTR